MYYVTFAPIFLINLFIQFAKWITKGFYRVFKYAWLDTVKSQRTKKKMTKPYRSDRLRSSSPCFIDCTETGHKKRHRRGHRGGKKHRKNRNNKNRGGQK